MFASPSGNRTPVSRVTGGDTHHYTNEDARGPSRSSPDHVRQQYKVIVIKLQAAALINAHVCSNSPVRQQAADGELNSAPYGQR